MDGDRVVGIGLPLWTYARWRSRRSADRSASGAVAAARQAPDSTVSSH